MSRYKKAKDELEEEFIFRPTTDDVRALRSQMAEVSPRNIGGTTWYPYELILLDRGILGHDKHGRRVMRNATEFEKYEKIHGLLQWQEDKDQESLFQANPEERVAHESKQAAMFRDTRALMRAKAV